MGCRDAGLNALRLTLCANSELILFMKEYGNYEEI